MPESYLEVARRLVEAYNARDIEPFITYSDPSIEYHAPWAGVTPTVYRGHEGLRRWHRELADAWEEIRAVPDAYFDLGTQMLVYYRLYARGRQSGADVETSNAVVYGLRDGLVVYAKAYLHREEALSDLGVAEDELEPIDP